MANLSELPAELLIDIVHSCSHTDIKHLSETCRLLHNKLLPELFRTLDLSTHSATVECPYEVYSEKLIGRRATGRNAIVSSRSLAREWIVIDKITARKQELLVRTIAEKPTYGNYVRELHWTVLDTYQNISYSRELLDAQTHYWRNLYAEQGWAACACGMRMVHEPGPGVRLSTTEKRRLLWKRFYDKETRRSRDGKHESTLSSEREQFPPEDESLWRTFCSFAHVMNVDLCWLRPWREATLPTQLFHGAQSIRLSGRMTRELVTSILGGPRLESLKLNDLKLWAELEPAWNPNPKSSPSRLASLVSDKVEPALVPAASSNLQELRRYIDANRARLRMRPNEQVLAGTLDTLAARQIALNSLDIIIAGPASGCHPSSQDTSLYRSWARFLVSTRSTLCNLFFEQCEGSKTSSGPQRGRERGQTDGPRPMDSLFVQHVLPVLLGASWPHIKRMEIRGVGRIKRTWQPHPGRHEDVVHVAILPKAREQLRELLDYEAELVIEERSSAEGEHVDPADPGIPPIYSQWGNWKAIIDRREEQNRSDSGKNEAGGLATCQISPHNQMVFRWPYRSSKDQKSALHIVDTRFSPYEEGDLGGGPNPEIERA